jgi:hypothetical protein
MWAVYKVDNYFIPVVNVICDTLVNHCDKGMRVYVPMGPKFSAWFKVSKDTRKSGSGFVVRAEGGGGACNFRFRSAQDSFNFAADNYRDAEQAFYHFIAVMQSYRKHNGLPPLDTDYITSIAEKDSPPVTADNYAVFNGAGINNILNCLDGTFRGLAYRALHNKYAVTVYSENGAARGLPP